MPLIPVFYTPRQVALGNKSASPSAGKPAEVVASWLAGGFPIEIRVPEPVTFEDFCLAHEPKHVQDVLDGKKSNGFQNKLPSIAAALPWTTGSLLSAARHVVRERAPVVVSPTSGFHHAGYDRCDGFCTFNGLMTTVLALRRDGVVGRKARIGILDLDEHYGNGTDNIIKKVGEKNVEHYTYGEEELVRGDGDRWLAMLPDILKRFAGCELVIFQAGADPHSDDPFGRGILSTEQLLKRDRTVFSWLHSMRVPVVWNLAGGYLSPLRKVLDIHDNTMRACVETYNLGPLLNALRESP